MTKTLLPGGGEIDAETGWNAVEKKNKRDDARLGFSIDIELPAALSKVAKLKLAETMARETVEKYGILATVSVHQNGEVTNPKNPKKNRKYAEIADDDRGHGMHFHLTLSDNAISSDGIVGGKVRALNNYVCAREGKDNYLAWMRPRWAELANEALATAGIRDRITHQSYRAMGSGKVATKHEGFRASSQAIRAENTRIREANANIEYAEWERENRDLIAKKRRLRQVYLAGGAALGVAGGPAVAAPQEAEKPKTPRELYRLFQAGERDRVSELMAWVKARETEIRAKASADGKKKELLDRLLAEEMVKELGVPVPVGRVPLQYWVKARNALEKAAQATKPKTIQPEGIQPKGKPGKSRGDDDGIQR
jgi:hypothetical protein